jgi:hypothetical protein
MLTLGGFVLLLAALCVLLVCCGSPKRRKLAILMWSHPNPAMGPLYMPDEMRWEFALVIDGVNRVRRSQRSQPIGLSIRRQVILVTGMFGGGVECRPTALVVSRQSCPGSHLVFSQTSNRQWMTVLGSGNDASVVPFPGVFSCHLLYGLLSSFSPA